MSSILDRIDEAVAEHEQTCPCGRVLPAASASFYWCNETCQTAWQRHRVDPRHPSPAQIRAQQETPAAAAPSTMGWRAYNVDGLTRAAFAPGGVVQGMRMWGSWWPETGLGDALQYRRYCPQCRQRRPPVLISARDPDFFLFGDAAPVRMFDHERRVQQCAQCGVEWPGRPLIGTVERRTEPRHLIRLMLSDGYRGVVYEVDPVGVEHRSDVDAEALWERLERTLLYGPTDRERMIRGDVRDVRRPWDWIPPRPEQQP